MTTEVAVKKSATVEKIAYILDVGYDMDGLDRLVKYPNLDLDVLLYVKAFLGEPVGSGIGAGIRDIQWYAHTPMSDMDATVLLVWMQSLLEERLVYFTYSWETETEDGVEDDSAPGGMILQYNRTVPTQTI